MREKGGRRRRREKMEKEGKKKRFGETSLKVRFRFINV